MPDLRAIELTTLVVNLGPRCNQSCAHCYVDAGPHRKEQMDRETVDAVVDVLRRHDIDTLDITGGAPEINPHFRYLASTASELCKRVVDRCNLTILLEPGYESLGEFLAEYSIEITASMPSYQADHVDRQRGRGTFEKSIEALRMLNRLGYGERGTRRVLNLAYNPVGTDLAAPQSELEARFKHELRDRYGVVFSRLFAMNNMPVNRFHDQLVRDAQLATYMDRLVGAFNPATVDGLMCRHSLSVAWDGQLYDCEFNQACTLPLRNGIPSHISGFDVSLLRRRTINTSAHCFGCAAGAGSSCNGALAARSGDSWLQPNSARSEVASVYLRSHAPEC
ncbi:MAG: arsenosugar biosynthesis radical SAM (seleno)protein ArsS [Phycisphaerae bacterium]